MNGGYGPALPRSYTTPWDYPSMMGGGFGAGSGYPMTPGMGFGSGPANWSNFGNYPSTGFDYGWAPMSDDELEYCVEQSIDDDPTIPAHAEIDVAVRNGVVTLTGTVPNKRIKHAAGDDAWWLPQVIDVHNEIQVQPRKQRADTATQLTARRDTSR